jgi:hypothetical protein
VWLAGAFSLPCFAFVLQQQVVHGQELRQGLLVQQKRGLHLLLLLLPLWLRLAQQPLLLLWLLLLLGQGAAQQRLKRMLLLLGLSLAHQPLLLLLGLGSAHQPLLLLLLAEQPAGLQRLAPCRCAQALCC